jgi:alpha-D-xyloside xylohydrolase
MKDPLHEDGELCFPQRATSQVQAPNPTTEQTQRQAGPNFFKDGENVQFMLAEAVVSHNFRHQDNVLCVEVKTGQYINRTAQTHDSVMHQFIDVPDSPGVLYFEIAFFTADIFRVKYAGREKTLHDLTDEPAFPPPEARMLVGRRHDVQVEVENTETFIQLSSSAIDIHVQKKPFQIRASRHGETFPFWRQRLGDIFTSDVIPCSITQHQNRHATFEAFNLDPGEALYGLGERFDSVARLGRPVDFVNHDAIGTSNTRSYINVPFFLSTNGYGCFVNSTARTEWDMGTAEQGTIGFCTEEQYMDYFVISGPTPKDILTRYTTHLTGTSPLPQIWTFGLWLSRNSYPSWSVVDEVIAEAKTHRVPFDDIHLDTTWFAEDWNPDLIFSKDRFADHEAKMAALLQDGIHVSLWQYTFAPPREDNSLYLEGLAGGYFGRERLPDGSPGSKLFSYPPDSSGWRLDDAVIDFSNPTTRSWYSAKIASLIRQGASAIKTDFGDCIPPDAHYANIAGNKFQNLYSLVYNATIAAAIKSAQNNSMETTPAIWARSGTAGSQRYPVHWGGDSQCSWSGLQGSLRATLSMGLSGFAFHSHDIGGFIGKPDPELYIRWAQVGLLGASHSRTHGAGDDVRGAREPWAFGEEALGVFRKFVDLRYQLLPYIVEESRRGAERGWPLIRHLMLEWPEDRNVWGVETQYMFGESLMVAPVLMARAEMRRTMSVYFPKGVWFDFWSKRKVVESRGQWEEVEVPALDSMAIWVRGGAMICYAKEGRERTWNNVGEVVKVEVYGKKSAGGGDDAERWECGDGARGTVAVVRDGEGRWVCDRGPQVAVFKFDE